MEPSTPRHHPTRRPRRRPRLLLVIAGTLIGTLAGAGVALAIARQSPDRAEPSGQAGATRQPATTAAETTAPATSDPATSTGTPTTNKAPPPSAAPASTPVGATLPDGRHPTLLKAVHAARGEIEVDLVDILHDDAARTAAAAAGETNSDYYEHWIQNQNPTVRLLRVAKDAKLVGLPICEDAERFSTVERLAAKLQRQPDLTGAPNVFWITVRSGIVHKIEHEYIKLTPAC